MSSTSSSILPPEFADLEPFADWSLETEAERYAKRLGSTMVRMDYEYAPLRLPPDVDRVTATVRLQIQAEFAGWELARVRLLKDGTRQILLRRPYRSPLPGLST